jgi:hypothetical protein
MLLPEWRDRARAVGLDDPTLRAMLDREPYRPLDAAAKVEIADRLVSPSGLTAQASSFDRREVICAFAGATRQGATLGEVEAFADAFLADPRVVALVPSAQGHLSHRDVLRLDDGRVVPAMTDATRYSTRELLGVEREVIDRAVGERAVGVAVAEPAAVERALSARPTIGPDQAQMVRRLCSEGHRVHVVVGPPGTGKTFALDAAREAWEASGYVVVGAAVAREAARNLEDKAGIRATSVASLRMQLDLGGEYGLGPRTVVIVDEAGMLPTRDLHALVEHASAAGAAVVLVGDHHQLPEIDAGGAFRALVIRTDPIVLTENRRQRDEWGRRMLELIRGGHVRRGLELASDAGALAHAKEHLADTQHTASTAAQRRAHVEAELQGRRRPSRDNRRDLAQAQAIERDAQIAVGQAAERVHELHARVQSDRWPVEHAEDLARLAAVRDEIHGRAQRQVLRARHIEVPAYLLDELGQRPHAPKARGVWDRAAVRIEHYRSSFAVNDRHSALGDRPDELRARAAHDQTRSDVDAAQARLARDHTVDRASSRVPSRSHGLGR